MKQETIAQCWAHMDHEAADAARAEQVAYRQRIMDAMMAVAARHGAKIDWPGSDIENHVVAFSIDPEDRDAFAHDLASLLGGEID